MLKWLTEIWEGSMDQEEIEIKIKKPKIKGDMSKGNLSDEETTFMAISMNGLSLEFYQNYSKIFFIWWTNFPKNFSREWIIL
jgi:hypothetical protein